MKPASSDICDDASGEEDLAAGSLPFLRLLAETFLRTGRSYSKLVPLGSSSGGPPSC